MTYKGISFKPYEGRIDASFDFVLLHTSARVYNF